MNLYLLRHAIAADPVAPGLAGDRDRPLTGEGKEKLDRVIDAMVAMKLEFDVILSSPFRRTAQTAERVADRIGARQRLQFAEALGVGTGVADVIQCVAGLRPGPRELLLVGHEPTLGDLVARLTTRNGDLRLAFKKAGLCKLEVLGLRPGGATLDWMLTPRLMALMGRPG